MITTCRLQFTIFGIWVLCLLHITFGFKPISIRRTTSITNRQNDIDTIPLVSPNQRARRSLNQLFVNRGDLEVDENRDRRSSISGFFSHALNEQFSTRVMGVAAALFLSFAVHTTAINPVAFADDQVPTEAPQESVLLQEPPAVIQQSEETVVEEVWNKVNKYYIDRTFNGQNWNAVRDKFVKKAEGANDDKSMKLINEMVVSLGDKYSRVLDTQAYAAIQKFDLIGVGVTLMPNSQKEIVVGAPPIADSPSDKAGMKTGDFVTAVNGIPTEGRTAFDIIDQISENPNAKTVSFSIRRQGPNDLVGEGVRFEVTMERQNFMEVKDPVQYRVSERRKDGTTVGYIRLSEFNGLVKAKLEDALKSLKEQGANAYVLDLRMNTGGAFQSAVEISSLFVDNRVATYVVDSSDVELPFRTASGRLAIDPKDPLVVWIDGTSASASEVLAGSLHDNCRAVTMGSQSFGKGLIQAVYGLKNGAGLVLTVARYVTPSGSDIQGVGITPDIPGNVPPPPLIPVLSTDTSKVNFKAVSARLDPAFCTLPDETPAASDSGKAQSE